MAKFDYLISMELMIRKLYGRVGILKLMLTVVLSQEGCLFRYHASIKKYNFPLYQEQVWEFENWLRRRGRSSNAVEVNKFYAISYLISLHLLWLFSDK